MGIVPDPSHPVATSLRPHPLAPVSVAELAGLAGVGGVAGTEDAPVLVTGVTLDSREVRSGDLYAALPGAATHGARFAGAAVAAGAAAILTDPAGQEIIGADGLPDERELPAIVVPDPRAVLGRLAARIYGEPADRLQMFGITGTNGKTTTAYLMHAALGELDRHTGLIGTVETRIGDERVRSVRTTPEAPDLHALLAVMCERGADSCVMEVSSHAVRQHRVDGVRYAVAIFTNLSQDHLDYHGTMAEYFAAKAELFTPARCQRAVVCVDDEWGRLLAQTATVPVTTFAAEPDVVADWRVVGEGPDFDLVGSSGRLALTCHLPGTFNLANTAAAALALLVSGVSAAEVEAAMRREPDVPGRMERVQAASGRPGAPRAIVDYGHTPDAVDVALAALRPSTPGRLVVVLGAGGDRDRGKRAAMGAAAVRHADLVVVTDDNPRTEDPATIREAIMAGARAALTALATPRPVELVAVSGRGAAIVRAVAGAGADDTVVVLGKGHETGQEIAGVVHHFDDREALAASLDGIPYRPDGVPT